MANTNGYQEDTMSNRRRKQAAMLLAGMALFLYSPLVLAAAEGTRVLGCKRTEE